MCGCEMELVSVGDGGHVEMHMSCDCCTEILDDVCTSSFAMATKDVDDAP